jgi:uncharacterized protein YecE (DUF72 family)
MEYYIGCSGYYYPNWKKEFYPRDLPAKDWLNHYSTRFNTVELNGSFYRTPKLSDLKKYYEVTPGDFKFSVKMNRYITHTLKLDNSKSNILEYKKLLEEGLENKLAFYLFQLPPSFVFTEEHLDRVIQNIPNNEKSVVEFRHASWWNKTTEERLKNAGLTFCNVDYPKLESYFIHTSSCFYLRLHGRPALFKSEYSEDQLKIFRKHFPEHTQQNYIYFNNTYYHAAFKNALLLKRLVTA